MGSTEVVQRGHSAQRKGTCAIFKATFSVEQWGVPRAASSTGTHACGVTCRQSPGAAAHMQCAGCIRSVLFPSGLSVLKFELVLELMHTYVLDVFICFSFQACYYYKIFTIQKIWYMYVLCDLSRWHMQAL